MDDATSSRTRNRITRSGDDDAPDLVSAAPPEHDASELQDSAAHSVSTLPPALRRKRGLGFVTPKACSECRKRRAKVNPSQLLRYILLCNFFTLLLNLR